MKKEKKKRKSKCSRVIKALIEGKTFDLTKNNGEGFKIIKEMVANYMLRDCTEVAKHRLWASTMKTVNGGWGRAMCAMNERNKNRKGLPICYRHKPTGKQNLEFITTSKAYRNARIRNDNRLIRGMEEQLTAKGEQISPEKKAELAKAPKRRLLLPAKTKKEVK